MTCTLAGLGCDTIPVIGGAHLRSPFAELCAKRFLICQIHAFVQQEGQFLMPAVLRSVNFRPAIPSGSFGRGFSSYENRDLPGLRKDMQRKWTSMVKADWKAQNYGVPYDYLATLFAKRHQHLKANPDSEPFPTAMWNPVSPLPQGVEKSLNIYYDKRARLLLLKQPWVKQDFLDDDDILQKAGLIWKHYVPTIRMSEEEAQSLENLPSSDINEMKKTASQTLPESEDEQSDEDSKADSETTPGVLYEDDVEGDGDVNMVDVEGSVKPARTNRRAGREMQLVGNEHRKHHHLPHSNS